MKPWRCPLSQCPPSVRTMLLPQNPDAQCDMIVEHLDRHHGISEIAGAGPVDGETVLATLVWSLLRLRLDSDNPPGDTAAPGRGRRAIE